MEDKLKSKTYQTVSSRMQTEEATCALTMSSRRDGESVSLKYIISFKITRMYCNQTNFLFQVFTVLMSLALKSFVFLQITITKETAIRFDQFG